MVCWVSEQCQKAVSMDKNSPVAHPLGDKLMSRGGGYAAITDLDHHVYHLQVVLKFSLCLGYVAWVPFGQ